jgi:D-alanyl-D-alanine carboxypeptidase
MKSLFPRLFFALLLIQLFAAAPRADKVDDYVRALLAERHIPGAAVAVVKKGKIVKTAGYGLASVEFDVPVTAETVFEIGSVTKQMTAAAILLLVEEGRIDLDEKISKYLPNTPESWKNVAVRHLLTHTSGIKSYTAIGAGFELTKRLKRDAFIKALAPHPLDFETGSRYLYSNSGYNLLGFIIESVSGRSYWDFMRERIFRPLGMNHTFDRDPQLVIKNRATGYEWENGALVGRDYDLTDVFSAGAIVSTVGDLAKWDAAWRGDTLLKKQSKLLAWTPVTLGGGKPYPYGFGWRFSDVRGHRLVAHSGQTAGFGASISRYVDDDLTVIALTNLGESGMGTLVAQAVARFYLPAISLKAIRPQPEPDAKIPALVASVLRGRLANRLDAELLTPELARALATDRAKAAAARVDAFGPVKTIVYAGGETDGAVKIYRYRVETPKRLFLWRFAVNEAGKISEMTLEEEE